MTEQNPDVENLRFDGDVEFGDGSASSPSVTNIGDTNTGLYYPNQDEVGVTTGGTHRATFDASGLSVTGEVVAKVDNSKDVISLAGGSTGTNSYKLQLSTESLSDNRTITFPDQSGVVLLAGASGSPSSTTIANDIATNSDGYFPLLAKNSSGTLSASYVSSTKLYYNPSTGQLNASSFNSLSDETFKKDITSINGAMDYVSAMRGVSFTWKDTEEKAFGVIAQEIENVCENVVHTNASGTKSVNYSMIIPFLIEALKEQQAEINSLKDQIKELKQ